MSNLWNSLSSRERALALGAAAAVFLAVVMFVGVRAVGRVRDYDRVIDRLEQQYLSLREAQDGRGASVDKAFAEVGMHHSSAWTEAEIHNRLRDEIYRLAMEDESAVPGEGKKLVDIPTLRQGTLKDSGEGYRQYELTIKIPSTDIYSLIIFLMRLQASPQTLRIDGLDLARPSESNLLSASINVTRTVVDGAATVSDDGTAAQAPEPAAQVAPVATWNGGHKEDWQSKGCDLVADGEAAGLTIKATGGEGAAYMVQDLNGGTAYELTAEVVAKGKATLEVLSDADGEPYKGSVECPNDGEAYQLRLVFTTGKSPGERTKVRLPAIVLQGADSQAHIGNVVIKQVAE